MKQKTKQVKQVVDHHSNLEPGDVAGVFAAIVFGIVILTHWLGIGKSRRPLWKSYNPDGYVVSANGQLEHREIAEKILGRRLERGIDVHHMNGVRHDNRLENLCVMDHRDHMRYHRWYDWVKRQGNFPRQETTLRKLREDFRGVILADVVDKKIG